VRRRFEAPPLVSGEVRAAYVLKNAPNHEFEGVCRV
jgi:hypothetical protein